MSTAWSLFSHFASDAISVVSGSKKKRKAAEGDGNQGKECGGQVPTEVATSSMTRSDEDAMSAVSGVSASTRTVAHNIPDGDGGNDDHDQQAVMAQMKKLLHYIIETEESRTKFRKKKTTKKKKIKALPSDVETGNSKKKTTQKTQPSSKTSTKKEASNDTACAGEDSDEEEQELIVQHGFVNDVGDEDKIYECWTTDHFMKSLSDVEECGGVIMDSYDDVVSFSTNAESTKSAADSDSANLCQMARPKLPSAFPPELSKDIEKYLKKTDAQHFQNAKTQQEMIKSIRPKHLLALEDNHGGIATSVKTFISELLQLQAKQRIFDQLCRCQRRMSHGTDMFEVVLGLIHVRYHNEDNGTIVNGPLLELLVKIELVENGDIQIRAADNAKIHFNNDVLFALNSIRGGDTEHRMLTMLEKANSHENLASLFDNHDFFQPYLDCARWFDYGTELRKAGDEQLHHFSDNLVLAEAWCFFVRPQKSTVFSRDAWGILNHLEQEGENISKPMHEYLGFKRESPRRAPPKGDCDLMFPLPATNEQKDIVKRIVADKQSVTNITGAPGTGKTHTIVNIALAALSKGCSFASVSSNARACTALVEKLPSPLRPLCLDISSCKNGQLTQFVKDLEKLIELIVRLKDGSLKDTMVNIKNVLEKKKEALKRIDRNLSGAHQSSSDLLTDASDVIDELSTRIVEFPLAFKVASSELVEGDVVKKFQDLQLGPDKLAFEGIKIMSSECKQVFLREGFIKALEDKEKEAIEEKKQETTRYDFSKELSEEDKEALSRITVGGREPETKKDWQAVLECLDLMKKLNSFIELGCRHDDMIDSENGTLLPSFVAQMKHCIKLKESIDSVKEKSEKAAVLLDELAKDQVRNGYRLLEKRLRLLDEIQELESEFIQQSILRQTADEIEDKDLTTLQSLLTTAENINSKTINANGEVSNDKQRRLFEEFESSFKDAAPAMPFLVMTIEQVSSLMSPTLRFGVLVIDEASQSGPNALLSASRGNQLAVVGDGKQSSPSTIGLSEDRIEYLRSRVPKIPAWRQLGLNSNFFEFSLAACTRSTLHLKKHFRCRPELIRPSNEIYYNNGLIPVREPSPACTPLRDVVLNGVNHKGVNEVEVNFIIDKISERVRLMAEDNHPIMTIGVIALSAEKQVRALEEKWKNTRGPACNKYGSDLVNACKIRFGMPSDWQGDERDIIFLSGTYSPSQKGVKADTEKARREAMNVALSRAREEMILVRSYGIGDLREYDDVRRPVLEQFNSAGKQRAYRTPKTLQWSTNDRAMKAYKTMSKHLKGCGFHVSENKEKIWNGALRISNGVKGSPSALLLIENSGEDSDEFQKQLDEQVTLQRQRPCMRVDFLSLLVNFKSTMDGVLEYLSTKGICATNIVVENQGGATPAAGKCDLKSPNPMDTDKNLENKNMEVEAIGCGVPPFNLKHSAQADATNDEGPPQDTVIPTKIQDVLSKPENTWNLKDLKVMLRHTKQPGDKAFPSKKNDLIDLWESVHRKRLPENELAHLSKKAKR